MKNIRRFILPVLFAIPAVSAFALPDMVTVYSSDPMAKIRDANCTLCHESTFGGSRNAFGDAFGGNLHQITPLLRAQFPDYFSYPTLKINDNLIVHFSDPDNKAVVVESGGKKVEVDPAEKTVDGRKAVTPKQ